MTDILEAIARRRAVKSFDPVEIPQALREQILNAARQAPSSFNMQPYRFYWVESPERKNIVSSLCLGHQKGERRHLSASPVHVRRTARCCCHTCAVAVESGP